MKKPGNKITVVGAGNVGATCAYTLLYSGLVSELILIDKDEERAVGEAMDIAHGLALLPPAEIRAGGYPDAAGSDLVIITAGASQKDGETRMDLARRNVAVFENIVPEIVKHAPDAIIMAVTNPVDVLTHVTYKLSSLPKERIIGSGTVLDTARLRHLLANHTGVDPRNVHTYIIGEHGDTELAVFSRTTIATMPLLQYCKDCGECEGIIDTALAQEFYEKTRNAGYEVIKRKGSTYYAVAVAVRRIAEAILRDEHAILTISGPMEGEYGIHGLSLSVPCIVGMGGRERTLIIDLSDEEKAKLSYSAEAIQKALAEVGYGA